MQKKYTSGLLYIKIGKDTIYYILGKEDCDNYKKLEQDCKGIHLSSSVKSLYDKLGDFRYLKHSPLGTTQFSSRFKVDQKVNVDFEVKGFKGYVPQFAKSIKVSGYDIEIVIDPLKKKLITSSDFSIYHNELFSKVLKDNQLSVNDVNELRDQAVKHYTDLITKRENEYAKGEELLKQKRKEWESKFPRSVVIWILRKFFRKTR